MAYRDDLTLALDGLRKLAEGPDEQSAQRTVFYLNQWLATERPTAGEWKPDPMLNNLPRSVRVAPGLERLEDLEFKLTVSMPESLHNLFDPEGNFERPELPSNDLRYLQMNLWLHDIAQRQRRTQVPPELAQWLKKVEKDVGVPEAEQLAAAERVFDWTIRNIQLDALPPPPKGPIATAGSESRDPIPPPILGEVGPGYRRMPLELLVHGHGDAWERARVFILLCRQLNIDAVMLGLAEEASPTPRGWLPAVLVKGELHLFDTSLGLPIPGPEGKGIATLSEVVADPSLIRRLDVEGEPPYPVTEQDLQGTITAMIDAEPDALSRRMQMLQAALPKDQHFILSCRPSLLEPKLKQSKAIGLVSLWRVPLEAVLYQIGRAQLAGRDPAVEKDMRQELGTFDPNFPLARGRNLHLQGRFETKEQELGARSLYLQSRTPDQEIDAVGRSEIVRRAQGLQQLLPEDPQQQQEALVTFMSMVRTRKHHATYWLGLTYQEAGNHKAAIQWLADFTMQAVPASPWIPGARYNLARSYEDMGQWEAARKWLESDKDSPQRHGNLLRAKWIAQRHGAAGEQATSTGERGSSAP